MIYDLIRERGRMISLNKKQLKKSLNSNKMTILNTIVRKIPSPVADAAVSRKLGTHG